MGIVTLVKDRNCIFIIRMKVIEHIVLTNEQKTAIIDLWNEEYPEQIKYTDPADFDDYLSKQSSKRHYLLIDENNDLLGWAFQFVRDGILWFAIIVSRKIKGRGYGTLLLNELKKNNTELNGWVADHNHYKKQNGAVYESPLSFYVKNGFSIRRDIRLETEKLSVIKIEWRKETI